MIRYDAISKGHKNVEACQHESEYTILLGLYVECYSTYVEPLGKEELESMDNLLSLFEREAKFDILDVITTFTDIYVRFHNNYTGNKMIEEEVYNKVMERILKLEEEHNNANTN